jgi:multiple sugar transport system permease protein
LAGPAYATVAILSYSSMITLPVLLVFVAFQRAFVSSIASSGMKN